MNTCRGCESSHLERVLDLGSVPAADSFPLAHEPIESGDAIHPLVMNMCRTCGLAQLAEDDTVGDEPRGMEPMALRDQAELAVSQVAQAGWLRGSTVREFGSPHGGTWIPFTRTYGLRPARPTDATADVVLDSFGIMHEADQKAAFAERAAATAPEGVLLLQFHSLATIVAQSQWNALRHGHFAYYSMKSVMGLLAAAGMSAVTAWRYNLYGGTVLVAAVHGEHQADNRIRSILEAEEEWIEPSRVASLQTAADHAASGLIAWLQSEAGCGRKVYAYGAASRAVALFYRAGVNSSMIRAVADAAPGKKGRRMPGTNIPIISPDQLLIASPDRVLLTVPDLLREVHGRFPQLEGRWYVDGPNLGAPPVGDDLRVASSPVRAHAD